MRSAPRARAAASAPQKASPAPVVSTTSPGATAPETVELVRGLAAECGKNPIVVKDQPTVWGFVANRVYSAAAREAEAVLREGLATAEEIDQLLVDCFRWPVGPLTLGRGARSGWE